MTAVGALANDGEIPCAAVLWYLQAPRELGSAARVPIVMFVGACGFGEGAN